MNSAAGRRIDRIVQQPPHPVDLQAVARGADAVGQEDHIQAARGVQRKAGAGKARMPHRFAGEEVAGVAVVVRRQVKRQAPALRHAGGVVAHGQLHRGGAEVVRAVRQLAAAAEHLQKQGQIVHIAKHARVARHAAQKARVFIVHHALQAAPVVLHLGGGDVAVLGQVAGIAHLEGPEDLLHGQLIQSHAVEALQQLPQQNEPRAAVAYPRARRGDQRRVEDRFGAVFRLVGQFPQMQSRGKARRVRQDLGNGDVALVRRRIQKRAQPVPQAQFARLHGAQRQHAHHQRLGNRGQVIPGMLIGQGRVVLDGQAAIGAAVQHALVPAHQQAGGGKRTRLQRPDDYLVRKRKIGAITHLPASLVLRWTSRPRKSRPRPSCA